MNLAVFFITICLLISIPANAEVYKWIDEEGRTHYGEKPESGDASKIEITEPPRVDKTVQKRNEQREKFLEIIEEERAQGEEKKQQEKQEHEKLAKHCAELKDHLAKLSKGGTTYYQLDEDGNRVYMSEQEVASEQEKLEKEYKNICY